jgi:hypothetical protein
LCRDVLPQPVGGQVAPVIGPTYPSHSCQVTPALEGRDILGKSHLVTSPWRRRDMAPARHARVNRSRTRAEQVAVRRRSGGEPRASALIERRA